MPRNLNTYTQCAGPDVAKPHTEIGGLAGFIIQSWYFSGVLTITGGLAFLFGLVASIPGGWCIAAVLIIIALTEIKYWYYNERLLCIRDNECSIGTIISEPTAAFDGDRKFNLMLAPFTQLEIRITLMEHLEQNRDMLSDPSNFTNEFHPSGPPTLPSLNAMDGNPDLLKEYMKDLRGTVSLELGEHSNMYNQIVIGLVDTLLLNSNVNDEGNPKNFFERFYRKVASVITDGDVWDAIPTDYDSAVNWQGSNEMSEETLNPMFRFENNHTVPYLHCEIEGNHVQILLNDFIVALTAFTVGCAIGGPIVGLIIGAIAYLIKKLIDWITGNDGDAAEPDIDWDDPDFTGHGDETETTGDVVVTFGNWIMDEEHHQYFEIHPVRAYYIIAEDALGEDDWDLVSSNEDQIVAGPNYDPTQIDGEEASKICEVVNHAESQNPDSKISVTKSEALSYGMKAKYGGGGTKKKEC